MPEQFFFHPVKTQPLSLRLASHFRLFFQSQQQWIRPLRRTRVLVKDMAEEALILLAGGVHAWFLMRPRRGFILYLSLDKLPLDRRSFRVSPFTLLSWWIKL